MMRKTATDITTNNKRGDDTISLDSRITISNQTDRADIGGKGLFRFSLVGAMALLEDWQPGIYMCVGNHPTSSGTK